MSIFHRDDSVTLHHGDALTIARTLPEASADCIITSPPYFGLRDYGEDGQYGLESSPAEYVETMRALFSELRRALADDGTMWLNIGDSFIGSANSGGKNGDRKAGDGVNSAGPAVRVTGLPTKGGLPQKNLMGIPWRVAFALQDDGWILRNAIVWHKPNAMPESVTDRLATRYEQVFLFSKARAYWFDLDSIREPHAESTVAAASRARKPYEAPGQKPNAKTRGMAEGGANPGDVWSINTRPFPGAHFATMPDTLAERCVKAGCKPGGTVLDPFSGSGTTGLAAARHGRKYVGVDLSREYLELSLRTRLAEPTLAFGDAS